MGTQRCIIAALVLGSVALGAVFLGRAAFWVMYPEAVTVAVPETKVPARLAPAARKAAVSFDFRQMEDLNLFGARLSSQASLPGSAEEGYEAAISEDEAGALPVSRRGFSLHGTIVEAGAKSRAVLSSGKEEKTYLEGESIKEWKIVKVMRRMVILEKDGLRERLPFKDEGKRAVRSDSAKQDTMQAVSLDRGRAMSLMRDPAALARDLAALSPHSDKGRSGLLVSGVSSGGLLDLLELEEGDLLLRASQKRLTRLNDLTELAAELDMSRPVPLELEIMRGGTITLIRYKLD